MNSQTQKSPLRKYIEAQSAKLPGKPAFGRANPVVIKLAERSGLSAEGIYRTARGDYNLRLENAKLVSKATGNKVSVPNLMGVW